MTDQLQVTVDQAGIARVTLNQASPVERRPMFKGH
jgi:hypothetical protein